GAGAGAEGAAMTRAATLAAGGGRGMGAFGWFVSAAGGFFGMMLVVGAVNWVGDLIASNPALGAAAAALGAVALAALLVGLAREGLALARLGRMDAARREADRAIAANDRDLAASAVDRLATLYRGRRDLDWANAEVAERRREAVDAEALVELAERAWLTRLDQDARRAVELSARQVATATALAPLPLIDVAAALFVNLRMIRRVAEIYGGRGGALGAWRLFKAVATHLVATGAVAATDDLIGPILGGGVLARLSRRFGEGLVNGALTARVGVAAIEVCRPLPFRALRAPTARGMVGRALADLGGMGGDRATVREDGAKG
ncbi:MAG: TIGR01620 family protein, partial [Pseudomonadota bacterium]|nr:TIGR01620 family protein [Pseudomonadota bacterium]